MHTGVEIMHLPTVTSTNDAVAQRFDALGPRRPIAVRADEQTAGRGRRGRTWHSPPGNFYLSLGWPCAEPPHVYTAAPVLAALALRDTIVALAPDAVHARVDAALKIKWPNDLLAGDAKLAGILCEQPAPDRLIIGIGVNLTLAGLPPREPPALSSTCTTTLGLSLEPLVLACPLVEALARALADLERDAERALQTARERSAGCLAWIGRRVTLSHSGAPDRASVGVVAGLDESLRLLIHNEGDDRPRSVSSGELLRLD